MEPYVAAVDCNAPTDSTSETVSKYADPYAFLELPTTAEAIRARQAELDYTGWYGRGSRIRRGRISWSRQLVVGEPPPPPRPAGPPSKHQLRRAEVKGAITALGGTASTSEIAAHLRSAYTITVQWIRRFRKDGTLFVAGRLADHTQIYAAR